jgi:hypothetical protein
VLGHRLPSFESPARWSILAGPNVRPKGPTPSRGDFSTPDHSVGRHPCSHRQPTEADEQAVRIETARDDVRFWEKVRDDFSPGSTFNEPRRRLIEHAEKQLADQRPAREAAERRVTEAQMRFVSLTRGERVAGDDDALAREAALAVLAGQLRPAKNGRRYSHG